MKGARSSGILVSTYETTPCHNPEYPRDYNIQRSASTIPIISVNSRYVSPLNEH
jgi:hypothetical protein